MAKAIQPKYAQTSLMFGALPGWLGVEDAERLASYAVYDALYWNEPNTYQLTFRGEEDNPIYIPSPMVIIEATNRYLARGFDYELRGAVDGAELQEVKDTLDALFRRERFWAKFNTQKRFGLVRGDSVWHIIGDETKPAGRRLSLIEVDPGSYFPIEDDEGNRIGVHLVDQYPDPKDPSKVYVRRLTYRKTDTGRISSETTLWEQGAWDDRPFEPELKKIGTPEPLRELPPEITALPVYHIPNREDTTDPFGSSELRGFERIAAALTQGASDAELSLALDGLGMFVTNSGPPRNADGSEGDWRLGPGSVVELEGGEDVGDLFFNRISGINSIAPHTDFAAMLREWIQMASGVPNVAMGRVDVSVASSGIALRLEFDPLLAKNAEKEDVMFSVYDHIFYDLLRGWLPAYEQITFDDAVNVLPVSDDPMPVDRQAVLAEVTAMVSAQLITAETGRQIIAKKLGYSFPENEGEAVVKETVEIADARDGFARRLREEAAP